MVATPQRITMLPDREQVFRMSYEDFVAQIDESAHAEWINGEAIVFMSPKERHQALANFLEVLISNFVNEFELGIVRDAPYEMRVEPDGPAREPDLLFIANEHLDRVTESGLAGPADLVVEIISEESYKRDRDDKFYEYEAAGIPEYWLFDPRPRRQRAEFYLLNKRGEYQPVLLDEEGRYHSAILPGFWIKSGWLWQNPLPNPSRLHKQILAQIPPALRTQTELE
jgi:Uma2 family endonuclease